MSRKSVDETDTATAQPLVKKPRLDHEDLKSLGSRLEDAVRASDFAEVHACLERLEGVPMTLDLLQASKIGKTVNESLKQCSDTSAVERARELLQEWKTIVKSPPVTVEEPTAVDALASMLNSLPDLEALLTTEEEPIGRRIRWRSDNELVQMVEFGIMETCEDLRRRIDETHGGLMALHPHGQDTAEEHRRFHESRRKERAMGGNRLKMHLSEDELMDDSEIYVNVPNWYWPPKVKVLTVEALFDPKKLRSYERQDLADMHGARAEVVYERDANVPENPSEPSLVSGFKLQQNATIDILLGTGIEDPIDLEPTAPPPPPPVSAVPVSDASFDDEFVKLDSKLQTVILGSEPLLNLFTRDPALLREITAEKLESILNEIKKQSAPPPMPHTVLPHDDRKGWGAATIRSAVRKEVMSNFVPPPHGAWMPPPHPQYMPDAYPPPPVFPHPGMRPPPIHPHPTQRGDRNFPQPPEYAYRGPPRRSPPRR